MKLLKDKRGITLVELIVVIGLLAIVAVCVGAYFEPLQKTFAQHTQIAQAKQMHISIGRTIREKVRFAQVVGTGTEETTDTLTQTPSEPAEGEEEATPEPVTTYDVLYIDDTTGHLYYQQVKDDTAGTPVDLLGENFYNGGYSLRWSFNVAENAPADGRLLLNMHLAVVEITGSQYSVLYDAIYPIKMMNIQAESEMNIAKMSELNILERLYYVPYYPTEAPDSGTVPGGVDDAS